MITFNENLLAMFYGSGLVHQVLYLSVFSMSVNHTTSFVMPKHVLLASGKLVSLKNFILVS